MRWGDGRAGKFCLIALGVGASGLALARAGGGGGYHSGSGHGGGGGGGDSTWVFYLIRMLVDLIFYFPAVGIPVTIAVIVIAWKLYHSGHSSWSQVDADWGSAAEEAPAQARHDFSRELEKLKARDPHFDEAKLCDRARLAFVQIQNAWSARDLAKIRPLVTDGVQERFEILLDINARCEIRNVMRDVQVSSVDLRAVRSTPCFDTIELKITASAVDYYVKEGTNTLVYGGTEPEAFAEYWSYIRRPAAQTTGEPGLAEGHCPSCGAPLSISDRGACQYCQALVNSGAFDWVLAEITQTRAAAAAAEDPPGVDELTARDPAFSVQYAEDRASVMFWRIRLAEIQGAPGPMEGVGSPALLEAKRGRWRKLDDGGTKFYADPAVGAVDVASVTSGDGVDRMTVRIKWSGREVKAKLPQLIKPDYGVATTFDQAYLLVRGTEVKSPDSKAFSSRACAACGAPETRAGGAKCARCGVTLNTGELDWVLESVQSFSGADLGVRKLDRAGPSIDDALAAAVSLAKADGRIKPQEYALLLTFAASRGRTQDDLDRIIARVENNEGPAAMRFVKKEHKKNFLYFMLQLCVADGEISAEEEAYLLKLGSRLGVDDVDLPKEIAKARAAL